MPYKCACMPPCLFSVCLPGLLRCFQFCYWGFAPPLTPGLCLISWSSSSLLRQVLEQMNEFDSFLLTCFCLCLTVFFTFLQGVLFCNVHLLFALCYLVYLVLFLLKLSSVLRCEVMNLPPEKATNITSILTDTFFPVPRQTVFGWMSVWTNVSGCSLL